MQTVLALFGLVVMAAVLGYGANRIISGISFKQTTDRYRYEKAKDEDGNEIIKVVDLEDTDERT